MAEQTKTGKYIKICPVCKKGFQTDSRNQKYCNDPNCKEFAQKKVGRLRKRRRERDLNRQYHLEWTRKHREHRELYLSKVKLAICQDCGKSYLHQIAEALSNLHMSAELLEQGGDRMSAGEVLEVTSKVLNLLQDFQEKGVVLLKDLEVHHVDGDFRNGEDVNLHGICPVCHNKAESILRKSGKSDEIPGGTPNESNSTHPDAAPEDKGPETV